MMPLLLSQHPLPVVIDKSHAHSKTSCYRVKGKYMEVRTDVIGGKLLTRWKR